MPRKSPKVCICVETEHQHDVQLLQVGRDNFTVVYGCDRKVNLDYSRAAHAFGAAVMHALACADKLDNRARGEK